MKHQITLTVPLAVAASDDLYLAVRTAFVAKGTTLNAWCKANGVNRQTADKALQGLRTGRCASELRQRSSEAAFALANVA